MRIGVVWVLAAHGIALGCAACSPDSGPVRPPEARTGRLVVERARRGRPRLVDAVAQATYCRGDSVLVIVALDRSWGAGLALRTPFPPESVRTLIVSSALSGDGSATAAFRAVADSVRSALEVSGGSVTLGTESSATGSFVISLSPRARARAAERLTGAFRSLATADTTASCGSPTAAP